LTTIDHSTLPPVQNIPEANEEEDEEQDIPFEIRFTRNARKGTFEKQDLEEAWNFHHSIPGQVATTFRERMELRLKQ